VRGIPYPVRGVWCLVGRGLLCGARLGLFHLQVGLVQSRLHWLNVSCVLFGFESFLYRFASVYLCLVRIIIESQAWAVFIVFTCRG
jgi:hypothetical protein